jgi:hypothetical protein
MTVRAPAYAGRQAHNCPVCLNVHGGEEALLRVALDRLVRASSMYVQSWIKGRDNEYAEAMKQARAALQASAPSPAHGDMPEWKHRLSHEPMGAWYPHTAGDGHTHASAPSPAAEWQEGYASQTSEGTE